MDKRLVFSELPAYASFLLLRVEELTHAQIRIARELNLPLLKHYENYTEQELVSFVKLKLSKMLMLLSKNAAEKCIEKALAEWVNNKIPSITRDDIISDDIIQLNFIRRKVFRDFLSGYTKDPQKANQLLEEIDVFTSELEAQCFQELLKLHETLNLQTQSLAKIGNWTLDLATKQLTWSDELYHIYELTPVKDGNAYDLRSYTHPMDVELIRNQIRLLYQNHAPSDFYYRIIIRSGKEKYLHAKAQLDQDEKGNPLRAFGTIQDVTEQKEAENTLKVKQNFIQKIADLTPSLISAYNVHTGKYLFLNKAIEKILGYDREEVMPKGISFMMELIHPDDLPALLKKNEEQLAIANVKGSSQEDAVVEFRYRMRHKNGMYRWILTYATVFNRASDHSVQDVINISNDITEEKNAEDELLKKVEELRKSEESYHGMVREVQDYLIILLDKEGNIQTWNIGAEKIKGYSAPEVIGKSFQIFYTEEDRTDGLPQQLLNTARTEGRATHEGWRVKKSGTVFWGFTVITALHDKKNEVIGFSKVTKDLTAMKVAEDQLRKYAESVKQQNKKLEQVNKELESFSYIASHDLQEPLRKIQAFSSRLMEKEFANLSDWGKDVFMKIQGSATRMQRLIEALLNFSRLNNAPEAYKAVDLNFLLEEVKSNLNEVIEKKKAVIESDTLPTINCVPFHFQQLFTNLLSNGLKYQKPDITPHIQIRYEVISGKDILKHTVPARKKFHHISFSDNGIGFDQQYSEKIFELFQRLHGKAEYEGTGIGLAICKKIVENHRGFIVAEGFPGEGSVFHVYLPLEKSAIPES